jgi:RHS repeat-associated protein
MTYSKRIAYVICLAALAAPLACAAYQPYYSDALTSVNTANWYQNGTITTSSGGFTSTGAGSLISKVAVPDGTSEYQVKMTLKLTASGGYYLAYLHGSSNAMAAGAPTGTYYAVQLAQPAFSGGACSGTLQIYSLDGNGVTILSSASIPCHDGMTITGVMVGGGVGGSPQILVYCDDSFAMSAAVTSLPSGAPGVGVAYAPSGNSISKAELGPRDRIAPTAVNAQLVSVSAMPSQVDFQFQGVLDDPNGTGISNYALYRNGTWISDSRTPDFTDASVSAGTSYSYQIVAADFHTNTSSTTIAVTTPPASAIDPRETGVRPTGSYWGASGENIDMRSGNLNFSIPLLKAQGRGGWGVGFNLTYNSQNWRQDPGGTWQFGRDVGYGYGWKLQAGSLTPIYQGYFTLHHYLYVDATGAQYRLDQNNNGVWTSKESIYVSYDSSSGRLYFNDGSFWVFGSQSAGTEEDGGTFYPTLMQDSNGNQVIIRYNSGLGVTWSNSSSRIQQIEDVRAVQVYPQVPYTYAFTYNTDSIPHLTGISNLIQTSENYTFTYTANVPLYSPYPPFNAAAGYNYWSFLQNVTTNGVNLTTRFAYDATLPSGTTGELTQVTLPYNGHLRWEYTSRTLSGSRTVREVANRYLLKAVGAAETQVSLQRSSGDSSLTVHAWADLFDWQANAEKAWFFQTDGTQSNAGLQTAFEERQLPGQTPLTHQDYTWSQDPSGNLYIGSVVTVLDARQTYWVQKKTTQVQDAHGNVTQMQMYDFGNLTTPARTYTNTYLTDPNYTSRYIFNRLVSSVVTNGAVSTTLIQNTYDGAPLFDLGAIREHDPAYSGSFTYRGNVASSTTPSGTRLYPTYDSGGNVMNASQNGVNVSSNVNNSTNYAAPSAITTGALTNNMNWTSFLGLSSQTGPNGDTTSMNYDANARPQNTTSPFGALTTYTYNDNPPPSTAPNKIAITLGRFTKTSYDGLGRTIRVETGDGNGTKSQVDTVYDSCGCTPLGKMTQQSMPYTPGATPVWTQYTYDGLGRTLTVTAPDNSVTSTYAYQGNVVTVTDAGGKWKKFSMDAFGNLTQVQEPDPALGTVSTNYTYDILNHLTQVSMPRGGVTQTRAFNYIDPATNAPGALLRGTTNPENGTVNYTYNADRTLATKTDAKGQQFTYAYDSYKRLTTISVGGNVIRTYIYDSNTLDSTGQFSQYGQGRLVAIQHAGSVSGNGVPTSFIEMFSYTAPGSVAAKRLRVTKTVGYLRATPADRTGGSVNINGDLDTTYAYDTEGKMTNVGYPGLTSGAGPSYTYSFDTLGRPNGLTDHGNNLVVVSNVQYGPSNELLQLTMAGVGTETRQYNSRLQLTNLTIPAQISLTYTFNGSNHNDDRIASQTDAYSGEQISYLYDSLSRLASAAGSGWSQSYTYDGFGNLLARNATGFAPAASFVVDAATNRLSGYSYDNNGNLLTVGYQYDAENRLASNGGGAQYFYDARNKRIWQAQSTWDNVNQTWNFLSETFYFYGTSGQMLGSYQAQINYTNSVPTSLSFSQSSTRVYFGRKLIAAQDRLGSTGKYFPYGEERNNPPLANDQVKFATYTRDAATGLDYADQRYYAGAFGRFMNPDPYSASAQPQDPKSWNRYAYVRNDPANANDPTGLCGEDGTQYCIDDSFGFPYTELLGVGGVGTLGGGGGSGPCSGNSFDPVPNPVCYVGLVFFAPPPEPSSAQPCGAAYALQGNGEYLEAAVMLGENSWYLIGRASYRPGDTRRHPTGSTITRGTVSAEDFYFASVLANRAQASHTTIEAAIGYHPGEFNGLTVGLQRLVASFYTQAGTSLCDDLTDIVEAIKVTNSHGSFLPPEYLYWKAIDQGRTGFHKYHPGDIYVGNTAFSVVN